MKEEQVQRCGFCGRYFQGFDFLSVEELKSLPYPELESVGLGYCPDAQEEQHDAQLEVTPRYVTRDMAIDAGDLSLEGTLI